MKAWFSLKRLVYSALVLAILGGVAATTTDGSRLFEMAKQIEIYTNLYRELNTGYVDEVDPARMMRTGMEAMVSSLDPFTNYIAASDIEGYRLSSEGHYSGVGAGFVMIDEQPTVSEILSESPAQKAGLQVGDKLKTINGRSTAGRSVDDIKAFLQGAVGSAMSIEVEHPNGKSEKISITRAELSEENVPYSGMLRDGIGYIHLSTFTRDAGSNVGDALRELKKTPGLKGLVLDLRGNGGGLLNEAVNLVGNFVPKNELIVTTRGREKANDHGFRTVTDPIDLEIPIAVLVDKHSASSSEIVSGSLQDLDRAVIIGQRTYGKGLVQNTRDIGYNAILKLTTAKYYIPSGRCIQSVKYENGKPVNVPDSLRGKFTTKAGRTVLDGGGIKPEVVLSKATDSGLLKDLSENFYIFRFATQYAIKQPIAEKLEDIRFDNIEAFIEFLSARNYVYTSEAQRLLDKAYEAAFIDGADATTLASLKQQRNSLQVDYRSDLRKQAKLVNSLIEKELAGRKFFITGKVQIGLRNDPDVDQAISILLDPVAYKKLLSK